MWIPLSIAAVLIAAAIFFTQVKVINLSLPTMQGIQMKYVWYGAGGLVGIIVLALIGKYVAANSSGTDSTFWVSVFILLVLAVLGAMGKGGSSAKWALTVVGLFVISQALFGFTFGENAEVVAKHLRTSATAAVLEPSKEPPLRQPRQVQQTRQDDWYGVKHTLTVLKHDPPKPIMVEGGRCIRWWGANPDGTAFTAYVRDVNQKEWHTWDEYRKKYPGRGFGWARFEPTGESAEVTYAFYKTDECG